MSIYMSTYMSVHMPTNMCTDMSTNAYPHLVVQYKPYAVVNPKAPELDA